MKSSNNNSTLFLMAGGPDDTEESIIRCMRHAIKACCIESPQIAYIGVASGDNIPFFKAISNLLKLAGAGEVFFPHLAKTKANRNEAKKILTDSDLIFVSGGDVEIGMKWLRYHNIIDFLKELYTNGTIFCGLSAGSIMLGAKWVRWQNPDDDSTAELFDCMNFTPTVFDTHAEDDNWVELRTALSLLGKNARGIGIPCGAMIKIDKLGTITDIERHGIIVHID